LLAFLYSHRYQCERPISLGNKKAELPAVTLTLVTVGSPAILEEDP